ncbi:hypothetical protein CU311_08325 [Prochlorococcus marinus str. MU1402]|nr:hypothetical protein [Prochlorococcus marinus str. MU1402]
MIASIELSLNLAKFIRNKVKYSESVISNAIQTGKTISTERHKLVFHPGVGHSHQLNDFRKNINTSELSFDNLSATEVFQNDDDFSSQFKVLTLGGSTTDPLGTQFSGFRGTWVHHLFDGISQNNFSRYLVENAGSAGATSSNELLRLITKFHSNKYDLVISFNGINEIYFYWNPYLRNKENVLASNMLLRGINSGVIKGLEGKTFKIERTFPSNLIGYIKESTTFKQLSKLKTNFLSKKTLNPNLTKKELGVHNISKEEKELLAYSAGIWEKNIKFMNSASLAMNSKYLVILQPTLGLNKDYCKIINENCLILDRKDYPKYLARIRYLYSILRELCSTKNYCLDISNDLALTIDDSLYTDARHPNNEGNKRIADLIRERVTQMLGM